jgi:hypothetical protein
LNYGRRLEKNFPQRSASSEAVRANETGRFWDFKETKPIALTETALQQIRYTRWTFEIETPKRRATAETLGGEKSDLPINTKSFGTAQISNQFATVSPQQTIIPNQKVAIVYNKWEMSGRWIETLTLDELN